MFALLFNDSDVAKHNELHQVISGLIDRKIADDVASQLRKVFESVVQGLRDIGHWAEVCKIARKSSVRWVQLPAGLGPYCCKEIL